MATTADARQLRQARVTWVVPMVLFVLTTAVESMSWTQLSAFTPLYLGELGVRPAEVPSWIAAMSSLGWVLALPLAPFWGVLADRYSRKAVVVRSAVAEGVIFMAWALTRDPHWALFFRCLNGFVLGNTGVMLAMQATTTPVRRLGFAVGVVAAGGPLGRTVGPLLGALLVGGMGVRGMLWVDAVLSFGMAAVLAVLLREPARERPVGTSILVLLREAVAEIASHAVVRNLFIALALAQTALWVMLPYVPIFVAADHGSLSVAFAVGLVASIAGLASAIALPAWGRVIDRQGHLGVLVPTTILAAAALLAAGLVPTLAGLTVALVLYGVGAAAMQTALSALLARVVSPERRGAVLGQVLFPFYVAGMIGPPLGALAFPYGRFAVFALAAMVALLPIPLVLGGRPR